MTMEIMGKDKLLCDTARKGIYCIFAENSTKMKRFGILTAFCLLFFGFSVKASAQFLPDVPDMKGKMIYGGDFGFGMSGNYLNFSIAPQVGYRIFSPWEVGVRGSYNLQCFFNSSYGSEYSHYFGFGPYTNYQVYKGIFLHVEDEVMYGFTRWNHQNYNGQWYNSVFVGAGYRQYSYSGSFVYYLVLYNLSWGNVLPGSLGTPYSSPFVFRVGFCF